MTRHGRIRLVARIFGATIPMLVALHTALPSLAQGTQADYKRAVEFPERIPDKVFRRSVQPRWLLGNNGFWYRIETGPGEAEFVFVNALKGERLLAFDHAALATALTPETGQQVQPNKLPFTWIQPAPDGSWVRFRIGEQVWQFGRDGKLKRTQEPLTEEKLSPLARSRWSRNGGSATSLTFVNRTQEAVQLLWVDPEGKEHAYGEVARDASRRLGTYAGHVWKVLGSGEKPLGIYQATEDEAQAVIGEESAIDAQKRPAEPQQPPAPKTTSAPDRPARKLEAFIRDFNIWLREPNGNEAQLTRNGDKDSYYREPVRISPDGRFAVATQERPPQEHKVHMVESSPTDQLQPKLLSIDYLKPGDDIGAERPRLFNLETRTEIPTSDELFSNPWNIDDMGWNEDSQNYRFFFNQRGHQHLRILEMSTTGQVRAVVDESSATFIDYSQKTYWHEVKGRPELIWASERDGWNHLYLYDTVSGTVKNQTTKGAWMMREVVRVDETRRQIWFRAFGIVPGQDPYYAHLARVNFDGTGLTVLTSGDGTHQWKFSPDNRFFVDTYSRVDKAPVTALHDAETGKKLCDLETGDIKPLLDSGWTPTERFQAPGRDGKTPIYGIIIRPSNFDPAQKYPVIEQIYAGPHDFFVPKVFDALANMHALAELGFIVVQIDGMGTNWRSKAFHDVCWKNLKDAGFPDRIAWMRAAAETRPWMDLERVGIYGGSAGGQNALAALLFHGDFYKTAAADCGCHDNRMDKIWWNEAWMGWPVGPEYADNSNVVHAANLRGNLLLIVGELDTNVDPASTMQVANALIKADKDFDLLVIPGAGHGAGGSPYGVRRQRDFFVRHLLGVEPPKRNLPSN